MTDIVERLRVAATHPFNQHGPCEFLTEAADEIARLTTENEKLRVALEEIDHGWESPMDDKAYRALCRFMWETARAALGEQP